MKLPGPVMTGVQSLGRERVVQPTMGGAIAKAVGNVASVASDWIEATQEAEEAAALEELAFLEAREREASQGLRDVPGTGISPKELEGVKADANGNYRSYDIGPSIYTKAVENHIETQTGGLTFPPSKRFGDKVRRMRIAGQDKVNAWHLKKRREALFSSYDMAGTRAGASVTEDTREETMERLTEYHDKMISTGAASVPKAQEWLLKKAQEIEGRLLNDAIMEARITGDPSAVEAAQVRLFSGAHMLDPDQEAKAFNATESALDDIDKDRDRSRKEQQAVNAADLRARQDTEAGVTNAEIMEMAERKAVTGEQAKAAIAHNYARRKDGANITDDESVVLSFQERIQAYRRTGGTTADLVGIEMDLLRARGAQGNPTTLRRETYNNLLAQVRAAGEGVRDIPGYKATRRQIYLDLAAVEPEFGISIGDPETKAQIAQAMQSLNDYVDRAGTNADPRAWWRSQAVNFQTTPQQEQRSILYQNRLNNARVYNRETGEFDFEASKQKVREQHDRYEIGDELHRQLVNDLVRFVGTSGGKAPGGSPFEASQPPDPSLPAHLKGGLR